MKKKHCPNCKKVKTIDQFSKNRSSSDGLTTYCNQCNKEKISEKRRDLNFMLKSVPVDLKLKFKTIHSKWKKNGFPPHLKPLISMGDVMTKIESKPKRRGRSVDVFNVRENGELKKMSTHDSIKGAVDMYGVSYQKIKYSSEVDVDINGIKFKINYK